MAKPAIRRFCMAFSKQAAHRRRELAFLLRDALLQALQIEVWQAVARLRGRLANFTSFGLAGRAARQNAGPTSPGSIFQIMAETGPAPNSPLHLKKDGRTISDPGEVEKEVVSYFEALFQGRHAATVSATEPVDSGCPFKPNYKHLPSFLSDLSQLQPGQCEDMERPVTAEELAQAARGAAAGRSPGLDGLTYEFYTRVIHLVGDSMAAALNTMLANGEMTESLRLGAVRLLPKVAGVPAASQLRPITLLSTDYKLLTKVFCNRLLPLLPTIISPSQLCAVPGRSIFDGCITCYCRP